MRYSRKSWGASPALPGPGRLDRASVVGIALHWPGTRTPIRGAGNVSAALRGWQALHMGERGWSDIAYQEAIDQDGNVYGLRGLRVQSGANGNSDLNRRYGALLLVLAEGEQPTPAMIAAVRRRIRRHRRLFPHSRQIVGHGQIRPDPTACPGPAVLDLITQGAFTP